MAEILTFVTVVAPLATVALTLLLWAILVVMQTPRRFWRDSLNASIAGLLHAVGALLLLLALDYAGVSSVSGAGYRVVIVVAGAFALIGLPRTLRELRLAVRRGR